MNHPIDVLVIPKEKIKELNLKNYIISTKSLINNLGEFICPFDDTVVTYKLNKLDGQFSHYNFGRSSYYYFCNKCKRGYEIRRVSDNSHEIQILENQVVKRILNNIINDKPLFKISEL